MDARSDKPFDSAAFLLSVGLSRKVVEMEPEQSFFRQGDPADSIFCLQTGRAKLVVVSEKTRPKRRDRSGDQRDRVLC